MWTFQFLVFECLNEWLGWLLLLQASTSKLICNYKKTKCFPWWIKFLNNFSCFFKKYSNKYVSIIWSFYYIYSSTSTQDVIARAASVCVNSDMAACFTKLLVKARGGWCKWLIILAFVTMQSAAATMDFFYIPCLHHQENLLAKFQHSRF